jgi:hypothetical protein
MDEASRRWEAHCYRMAEATHAIADWCEDPAMMGAYLELAARWILLANEAPARPRRSRDGCEH